MSEQEVRLNDEKIKKKVLEQLDQTQEKLDQSGLKIKIDVGKEEKKMDAEEEVKRLKEELEDRDAKLQIIFEKELGEKMDRYNIPESQRAKFYENPELLKAYIEGLTQNKNLPPAPNVPLNQAQMGQTPQGYGSHEEMIDDLRRREKSSDPKVSAEAHEILNRLFQKTLKGGRKTEIPELEDVTLEKILKARRKAKRRSE